MTTKKITPKQQRFVDEYLLDLNATQAAIRTGYSKNSAGEQAHELLKKPEIAQAVEEAKKARAEATGIDAMFVLTRLAEMVNADPCDIMDEDTGAYKKIHDWPIEWRRMLSAADVQELFSAGTDKAKIGEIVKYKFIDKLKAYELLGKHVNVQAFKDKIAHEGSIGITIDNQDEDL